MDRQKVAAVALLFVVLGGLTVLLAVLAAKGLAGSLTGEGGIGRFFVNFLGSQISPLIFESVAGVLGVGAAFLAGGNLSNRVFFGMVALGALAFALCVIFFVVLSDHAVASNLYNYGSERIANAESFRSAVNWAVGGACAWLIGVVGTLVGVRAVQ